MRLGTPGALLALGLLLLPGAAAAQEAQLSRVLDRIAGHWAQGEAAQIAALISRSGVSLDIDNGATGPVSARQAAAVLRQVLSGREAGTLRVRSARVVGGNPPRAFGELAWQFRARGTTIPEHTTVFIALAWEQESWRITQIRFLP
jgi:hypothetical protein